jgi:photosystem II stability/assembly factor-like uncharacterized protein
MKRSLFVVLFFCVFVSSAQSQWLKDVRFDKGSKNFDKPERYFDWFYGQRAFGLGYIPKDGRVNALRERDAMRTKFLTQSGQKPQSGGGSNPLNATWSPIGPINIEEGVMAHAGRIRTIAPHPNDGNIAYIGAAMGGVWKTTTAGRSWFPISDNAYSLAMGALAIDPKNPSVLYAGTGEQTQNIDAYYGVGILKSVDSGATWVPSGLHQVGAFSKIIVHPVNSNTVYAAGSRSGGGVYISDDAGKTWRKVTGGLPSGDVTDMTLAMDGSNTVIYVGMPSQGTYRSHDGGTNWVRVHSYLQMRRILLSVDPNNWRDIIDMSVDFEGGLEGVMRSTVGGGEADDWESIDGQLQPELIFGSNNQGWYDAYVVRNPENANEILVGGISVWRSSDGGQNWTDVGRSYKVGGIHPDQHHAAYAKPGTVVSGEAGLLFVANDGGIAISIDNGETFQVFQDSLAVTQFYGMAIDQNADDITYGGTQDNGTLGGGRNADWNFISGGDGGTVVVDEDNSQRMWYLRPGDGNNPIKIENGIESNMSGINPSDSVGWVKPLVMDQTNNILYTGTQFLYFSTNGSSWTRRSKKLASQSYINCIEPFGDGQTVAVGTTGGQLWYTTNNGTSFTERTVGLPGRSISAVKFKPGDASTFYVALSGYGSSHVMKTTDKGVSWTNISSTLPDVPATALFIDPLHPAELYIATDVGVFYSPNEGGTWMPYGVGMPNVAISDMAYHKSKKVLRVATHGRSMWEAPLANIKTGISTPTLATKWFIGEKGQIAWYGIAAPVKIEISFNNGADWKTLETAFNGMTYDIAALTAAAGYQNSDFALVRVSNSSETLISQNFRIISRSAGTTFDVVSEQPLYMYDIAYDEDDNVLWVTNFNTADSKIYKIHPDNGTLLGSLDLGSGRTSLTGIKYDKRTKTFYIHQRNDAQNASFVYHVSKTGSILGQWRSPAEYGTGIFPREDTLYLADRNFNKIYRAVISDPINTYEDILLERQAAFGPRCISFNPTTGELLHTWTDFQGNDQNAQLYDSYLLRLNAFTGQELSSYFVQEGGNAGTNVRGLEYDPRSNGESVWVTVLNSGNSSKILKLTLKDGPAAKTKQLSNDVTELAIYPNPSNAITTVQYFLEKPSDVTLIVRDMLGRVVKTLAQGNTGEGKRYITFDMTGLTAGTYVAELEVNGIAAGLAKFIKQ